MSGEEFAIAQPVGTVNSVIAEILFVEGILKALHSSLSKIPSLSSSKSITSAMPSPSESVKLQIFFVASVE